MLDVLWFVLALALIVAILRMRSNTIERQVVVETKEIEVWSIALLRLAGAVEHEIYPGSSKDKITGYAFEVRGQYLHYEAATGLWRIYGNDPLQERAYKKWVGLAAWKVEKLINIWLDEREASNKQEEPKQPKSKQPSNQQQPRNKRDEEPDEPTRKFGRKANQASIGKNGELYWQQVPRGQWNMSAKEAKDTIFGGLGWYLFDPTDNNHRLRIEGNDFIVVKEWDNNDSMDVWYLKER